MPNALPKHVWIRFCPPLMAHLFQNCRIRFSCHVGNLGLLKIYRCVLWYFFKETKSNMVTYPGRILWYCKLNEPIFGLKGACGPFFEFPLNSTFWENTFTNIHNIIFSLLGKACCYDTRQGKWSSSGSSQTGNITPEVSIVFILIDLITLAMWGPVAVNMQNASSHLLAAFAPSWPGFLKNNIPAVSSSLIFKVIPKIQLRMCSMFLEKQ